jgi:hypothetical protein
VNAILEHQVGIHTIIIPSVPIRVVRVNGIVVTQDANALPFRVAIDSTVSFEVDIALRLRMVTAGRIFVRRYRIFVSVAQLVRRCRAGRCIIDVGTARPRRLDGVCRCVQTPPAHIGVLQQRAVAAAAAAAAAAARVDVVLQHEAAGGAIAAGRVSGRRN